VGNFFHTVMALGTLQAVRIWVVLHCYYLLLR
jgi:hypothetical protein